jgi:8-oxo-dGTP pyrophosphatase MutT (NUDIX family)
MDGIMNGVSNLLLASLPLTEPYQKKSSLLQAQKQKGFFKATIIPRVSYNYGIKGLKDIFTNISKGFPNLSEMKFVKTIAGGTGGVSIYKDQSTGELWTLKTWKNRGHGINECLAAALYKVLGGQTPEFCLFTELPIEFRKNHKGELYRFARFIKGEKPSEEVLRKKLQSTSTVLALLSFWDIKPENYIVTKDGTLHLIDTGGALLYRALGELKKADSNYWMPHQVSELFTFRNEKLQGNYFSSIDNNKIKKQIPQILQNAHEMIQLTKSFCQSVKYEKSQEITHSLQSRLRHLELIHHFLNGRINPKADPFEIPTENDAAGTLIYTQHQNQVFILIGKRVRHQWWSNLGGKTDPRETFFDAASRESGEESDRRFKFDTGLIYCPSHDLITVDDNLLLKRYRTYLVSHQYVDPKKLKSNEYTEYKWVPVGSLLKSLNDDRMDKDTILYPPFLESLRQENVKNWLIQLAKGKSVKATCTQSVSGHSHLKEVHERLEHSASEAFRMAVWMTVALQNREIVVNQNKALNPKASAASYHMLRHLAPVHLKLHPAEDQIKAVTKEYLQLTDENISLVKRITQEEKIQEDKYAIYHGLMPRLWFQYRILSHIRHLLDGMPLQTDVLRPLDSFFNNFSSAKDLIDFIKQGRNNYSPGFKRAAMSFNPTIFNNLATPTSSSMGMLFGHENVAPPKDIWGIVKTLFEKIGITFDDVVKDIEKIYKQQFKNVDGTLIQVFLDPKIVQNACYIAASMGATVEDAKDSTVYNSLDVLQSIKVGKNPQLSQRPERIQVRLLADISKYDPGLVVVKDYFSNGMMSFESIDAEIKKMIQAHVFVMIRRLPHLGDVYSRREPRVIEVQRRIMGLHSYERKQEKPEIFNLIKKNNALSAIAYIMDEPRCLDCSFRDPDTLVEISSPIKVNDPGLLYKIQPKERQLLLRALEETQKKPYTIEEGLEFIQRLYKSISKEIKKASIDEVIEGLDLLSHRFMTFGVIVSTIHALCTTSQKIAKGELSEVIIAARPLLNDSNSMDISTVLEAVDRVKPTQRAGFVSLFSFLLQYRNFLMNDNLKEFSQFKDVDFTIILDVAKNLFHPKMKNNFDWGNFCFRLCYSNFPDLRQVSAVALVLITPETNIDQIMNILQETSLIESSQRISIVKKIAEFLKSFRIIPISNLLKVLAFEEESKHQLILDIYKEYKDILEKAIRFPYGDIIEQTHRTPDLKRPEIHQWNRKLINSLDEISYEEIILIAKAVAVFVNKELPEYTMLKWYDLLVALAGMEEKYHQGIIYAAKKNPSLEKLSQIKEILFLFPKLSESTIKDLLECTEKEHKQISLAAAKYPNNEKALKNIISLKYFQMSEYDISYFMKKIDKIEDSIRNDVCKAISKYLNIKFTTLMSWEFEKVVSSLSGKTKIEIKLIDEVTREIIDMAKITENEHDILQVIASMDMVQLPAVLVDMNKLIAHEKLHAFTFTRMIQFIAKIKSHDERSKFVDQLLRLKELKFEYMDPEVMQEFKKIPEVDREFILETIPKFKNLRSLLLFDSRYTLQALNKISKQPLMLKHLLALQDIYIESFYDIEKVLDTLMNVPEEERPSFVAVCMAQYDNSLLFCKTQFLKLVAKCKQEVRPLAAELAKKTVQEKNKYYYFYSASLHDNIFDDVFKQVTSTEG